MHDVRIIFTASKTPLGVLIRKITKSDVSHAMIEVPIWGKRMIMEATLAQNAKKPQGFSPGMNSQFNEVKQSFDCQCR